MLGKPRILSPTLIRQVRFVLDDTGYLSDHACLMIQPTKKTYAAWHDFEGQMNKVSGGKLEKTDLLRYCSAFLNSNYAQQRLIKGHRPTPKGSYAITEAYLKEIPIPVPSSKRVLKQVIASVKELGEREFELENGGDPHKEEHDLQQVVDELLALGVEGK